MATESELDRLTAELSRKHFRGTECGDPESTSACVNCFGGGGMTAHEIAELAISVLTPHDDLTPDGEFETARITITSYLNEDGSQGYGIHTVGDAPMTTYLGLTIVAQDHIKRWGHDE